MSSYSGYIQRFDEYYAASQRGETIQPQHTDFLSGKDVTSGINAQRVSGDSAYSAIDDKHYTQEQMVEKGKEYFNAAESMLRDLSSEKYQSRDRNVAFLMHSTGHHPAGSEIDASIIYADYYYIEALLRYKQINK